jgi:predicted metal-dependent enzyme (double-stranded beta helix superfamily)
MVPVIASWTGKDMAMFELERFIADCESAVLAGGQGAVREVLAQAIADAAGILAVLGEPRRAEVKVLYRSPRLTILNVLWPPHHTQAPHDHRLWAEIGVYCGREDNIFWRRRPPNEDWQIEAVGGGSIIAGRCHSLEPEAIHSVNNPLDRLTAGLHLYGGDLSMQPRTMWDGETLVEAPIDHARDYRAMDVYNASLFRQDAGV